MSRFEAVNGRSELTLEGESNIHPLHAVSTELAGYFEASIGEDGQLDLSVPVVGQIEMPVESLTSGNALVNREMRNRLDMRRFPRVVATLVEIREKLESGRYHAVGDLTFHGVTQRLEDDLIVQQIDEQTIEIQGEIDLDMRDFGVEPPKLLFIKVNSDVRATLRFVAQHVEPDGRQLGQQGGDI